MAEGLKLTEEDPERDPEMEPEWELDTECDTDFVIELEEVEETLAEKQGEAE